MKVVVQEGSALTDWLLVMRAPKKSSLSEKRCPICHSRLLLSNAHSFFAQYL